MVCQKKGMFDGMKERLGVACRYRDTCIYWRTITQPLLCASLSPPKCDLPYFGKHLCQNRKSLTIILPVTLFVKVVTVV